MVDKIINKQDIVQFITQEKKKQNINDIPKTFKLFLKILQKSIYEIYIKVKNLDNINIQNILKNGSDLLWHVFWIIYGFSFNIKLTMFLSERCILLFTEFIIMSRNPMLNNDLNFVPSTNDALQFSLKKTVGPLKLPNIKSIKIKKSLNFYKSISFDFKFLFQQIFDDILKYHSCERNMCLLTETEETFDIIDHEIIKCNHDILELFEKITNSIQKTFINIYYLDNFNKEDIYELIKNVFGSSKTLKNKICLIKIYLEIYYDLNTQDQNINIQNVFQESVKYLHKNNDELDNMSLDSLGNIKKKKIYKNIQLMFNT